MSYPFDWVEDLIYGHLASGLPDKVNDMAWKNLTFDPAGRTVWLKVINAPITEEGITLGPTGDNELRGFLQIGIYTAIGQGVAESKEVYGRVSERFNVPQRLAGPTGDSFVKFTSKSYSKVDRLLSGISHEVGLKVFGMQIILRSTGSHVSLNRGIDHG